MSTFNGSESLLLQLGAQHTLWQSGQAWLANVGWFPNAAVSSKPDEVLQNAIDAASQAELFKRP